MYLGNKNSRAFEHAQHACEEASFICVCSFFGTRSHQTNVYFNDKQMHKCYWQTNKPQIVMNEIFFGINQKLEKS